MPSLEDFVGKATCGCVHHAEEGVACPHDVALFEASTHPWGAEKTPSGRTVVFQYEKLFTHLGMAVPVNWIPPVWNKGSWCFLPADHTAENGWGHRLGIHQPYPHAYSASYATREKAMEEALLNEAIWAKAEAFNEPHFGP